MIGCLSNQLSAMPQIADPIEIPHTHEATIALLGVSRSPCFEQDREAVPHRR